MSNTILNAAIALIEDRPEDAREMLRDPSMKGKAKEVMSRFQTALNRAKEKDNMSLLRELLRDTMIMQAPVGRSDAESEAYLEGVTAVEVKIQNLIEGLDILNGEPSNSFA